jgi:hypothetical protein
VTILCYSTLDFPAKEGASTSILYIYPPIIIKPLHPPEVSTISTCEAFNYSISFYFIEFSSDFSLADILYEKIFTYYLPTAFYKENNLDKIFNIFLIANLKYINLI